MRPLKPSERLLAGVFGGMIFVLANFMLLQQLSAKRTSLQTEIRNLKVEKTEADFWLGQKDLWNERKAWIAEKQPKLDGTGQEGAKLLETVQQTAKEKQVTIGERTISEPETHPHYTEIGINIQAKGSLESITRWLAVLQNPETFQTVTSLTLKKDAESSNITCNATISRWYANP